MQSQLKVAQDRILLRSECVTLCFASRHCKHACTCMQVIKMMAKRLTGLALSHDLLRDTKCHDDVDRDLY